MGISLIVYYECALGLEHAAKIQVESPVVERWNAYMEDVMEMPMYEESDISVKVTHVFRLD